MLVRAATDGGGGAGSSSPLPHKTGNLMLLLLRVLGAGTPHNYGAVIYAESRRGCRLPAAVALGCNYKIGKCNVGQNNDPRTAGARRVAGSWAAMPARCKLNFKMTMWRRDETLYRQ